MSKGLTWHELFLELGGDYLARRLVNVLKREFGSETQRPTWELFHENRYELDDLRMIGTQSLLRLDEWICKKRGVEF